MPQSSDPSTPPADRAPTATEALRAWAERVLATATLSPELRAEGERVLAVSAETLAAVVEADRRATTQRSSQSLHRLCDRDDTTVAQLKDALAQHLMPAVARNILAEHARVFDAALVRELLVNDTMQFGKRMAHLMTNPFRTAVVNEAVADWFERELPLTGRAHYGGSGAWNVASFFRSLRGGLRGDETRLITHLTNILLAATQPGRSADRQTAGRLLMTWKGCPTSVLTIIAGEVHEDLVECRRIVAHPSATRATWDALLTARGKPFETLMSVIAREPRPLSDPDLRRQANEAYVNHASPDYHTFLVRCIRACTPAEAPEYIRLLVEHAPASWAIPQLAGLPASKFSQLDPTDLEPLLKAESQDLRLQVMGLITLIGQPVPSTTPRPRRSSTHRRRS